MSIAYHKNSLARIRLQCCCTGYYIVILSHYSLSLSFSLSMCVQKISFQCTHFSVLIFSQTVVMCYSKCERMCNVVMIWTNTIHNYFSISFLIYISSICRCFSFMRICDCTAMLDVFIAQERKSRFHFYYFQSPFHSYFASHFCVNMYLYADMQLNFEKFKPKTKQKKRL